MIGGEKVGQEQIHAMLFEENMSWRALIYDLINSEQLDPWNIDLSLLSEKYLEKVRLLEEANFFVSSNVLLAASLLLRLKSEILLTQDIPTLDDILFGKKEEKTYGQERIEFDENVPGLVPRTPLPRFRRVTLDELMSALGKAIKTETRRIKKHLLVHQAEREVAIALPRHGINLKQHTREVYKKLTDFFSNRDGKVAFSEIIAQGNRDERIMTFVSLLHLDTQQRVWLEQEKHFEEIWIWLKELYEAANKDELDKRRAEVEAFMAQAEKEQEESDVSTPLDIEDEDDVHEPLVSSFARVLDEDDEENGEF